MRLELPALADAQLVCCLDVGPSTKLFMGPGRGRNQLLERARLLVPQLNQSKKNKRNNKEFEEVKMKKGIHMMIWIHFFFLCELRTLLQNEARNATKLGEEKSRPQKVNSSQSQLHVIASTDDSCRILSAWTYVTLGAHRILES